MPKEVTVSSSYKDNKDLYKVAAQEYKAYLLTLRETEALTHQHQQKNGRTADPKWEAPAVSPTAAERRISLARERRVMLAQIRQDPFRPARAVTVRPRGVALGS
jgi:hypothetical protein